MCFTRACVMILQGAYSRLNRSNCLTKYGELVIRHQREFIGAGHSNDGGGLIKEVSKYA